MKGYEITNPEVTKETLEPTVEDFIIENEQIKSITDNVVTETEWYAQHGKGNVKQDPTSVIGRMTDAQVQDRFKQLSGKKRSKEETAEYIKLKGELKGRKLSKSRQTKDVKTTGSTKSPIKDKPFEN